MKIEIIVPIVIDKLFPVFLESVEANSILPQRIILIDNTSNGFCLNGSRIEITKLRSKTGKVNESWNLGIKNVSSDCDLVGIYNDDIVLNSGFFQRTIEVFEWNSLCAASCPNTVDKSVELRRGKVNRIKMKTREGWCFTIRKRVLDLMSPIPDNKIITFFGDNWFWLHTHRLGYFWGKDLGNTIWHHKGVSILETGERRRKRPDLWAWQELKSQA